MARTPIVLLGTRRKRLEELRRGPARPRFGSLEEIRGSEFVAKVTNAGEDEGKGRRPPAPRPPPPRALQCSRAVLPAVAVSNGPLACPTPPLPPPGEGVWVVCHLYKAAVQDCAILNQCLAVLAEQYPATKFVRIVSTGGLAAGRAQWGGSSAVARGGARPRCAMLQQLRPIGAEPCPRPHPLPDCIPNYPDENLPTVLLYRDTKCLQTLVGLRQFGGRGTSPDQVGAGWGRGVPFGEGGSALGVRAGMRDGHNSGSPSHRAPTPTTPPSHRPLLAHQGGHLAQPLWRRLRRRG